MGKNKNVSMNKKDKAAHEEEKGKEEWKDLDLDEDSLGTDALRRKAAEKVQMAKDGMKMGAQEAKRLLLYAASVAADSELAARLQQKLTEKLESAASEIDTTARPSREAMLSHLCALKSANKASAAALETSIKKVVKTKAAVDAAAPAAASVSMLCVIFIFHV